MSDNLAVQIAILGQNYTLTSPAGKEQHLCEAARLLDARLRVIKDSGRVKGLERMAVMAALNFSAEALQSRKDMQILEADLKQLDSKVSHQLDSNQDLTIYL